MENWALGKVAAVAADGSVAVSFTDASFCSCLPEIGEVEPARDPCCGGGGQGRVVGTVAGFTLDRLRTARRCPIQGPATSQPKEALPCPSGPVLDSLPAEGGPQGVVVRFQA